MLILGPRFLQTVKSDEILPYLRCTIQTLLAATLFGGLAIWRTR